MLITLYQENIQEKLLDYVVSTLENEGIVIIPTDTLYAFVCDIKSNKAAHRLAQMKGKQLEKSNFSILCENLSMASQYVKQLSKDQFSFIKKQDTGGFTFVLHASNLTPKIFQSKKRTIGIRIPQNLIPLAIISRLERPLLVSSMPKDEDDNYYSNAELIYDEYRDKVDVVVEDDEISNVPSTVVNMLDDNDFIIERQGLGEVR
jgi:tRNA threonylcarbamoyl adenosine modification protein (Sua5/YciO/YrdC/YwlC family)